MSDPNVPAEKPPQQQRKDKQPRKTQSSRVNYKKANEIFKESAYSKIPKMTPKKVEQAYNNPQDVNHVEVVKLVDHLAQSRNKNLTYAIGLKFRDMASERLYKTGFDKLQEQDKRHLLAVVLADDWAPTVRAISKVALPHIWNLVRQSTYGQKALQLLKDYSGIDLNDDKPGYLGNPFSFDPSLRRGLQWDELSDSYSLATRAYDGVSTQAISSILFPEFTSSRIPSDVAVKSGKVYRTQTYTLVTNNVGNAIFSLYPLRPHLTNYAQIWNANTLDVNTGNQSTAATDIVGPMNGLTSVVSMRTTATSLVLEPIVSSLNNQGRIVSVMSNGDSVFYANTAPTGITDARDREYVVYSSVAGCSGHRLVYYDSSVSEESFYPYTASNDADFLQIIIQGAAPSVAVLQLTVSYQVEYTIRSNVLVELSMPPTGPATAKCLSSCISQNPQLRLLGRQESYELYSHMLGVQPNYSSVMNLLVNHRLSHAYDAVHISSMNRDQMQGNDNQMMSFSSDMASSS